MHEDIFGIVCMRFSCILEGRNSDIRIVIPDFEVSFISSLCFVQYVSKLEGFSSMKHNWPHLCFLESERVVLTSLELNDEVFLYF